MLFPLGLEITQFHYKGEKIRAAKRSKRISKPVWLKPPCSRKHSLSGRYSRFLKAQVLGKHHRAGVWGQAAPSNSLASNSNCTLSSRFSERPASKSMVLDFTYNSTYEHHACTPAWIVSTTVYSCRHYTNTHTQSNKAIRSAKAMHLCQLGTSKILETSTWGHLHTWPSHVPLMYKLLLRKAPSIQVTPNIPLYGQISPPASVPMTCWASISSSLYLDFPQLQGGANNSIYHPVKEPPVYRVPDLAWYVVSKAMPSAEMQT